MKTGITFLSLLFLVIFSNAQPIRKEIALPQIGDYLTLKCDFHTHTVFSDGSVWPTVRIDEAWREGLDVISITDHLEYTPHKSYVPINHEAPYEITRNYAKQRGILLVKGTEITKSMPPGHFNALFIEEASLLMNDDPLMALREAKKQGAFVIWNHPGWVAQAPEGPVWMPEHQKLFDEKLFQGIEVANYNNWYPKVLDWATEKHLTIFSNSDIHQPIVHFLEEYKLTRRPMTLVFASEYTIAAVREALDQNRTIGWFQDKLFGMTSLLEAFFAASVKATMISEDDKNRMFKITNTSDVDYTLQFSGSSTERKLPARSSLHLSVPLATEEIRVTVKNMLTRSDEPLLTTLQP